MNLGEIKERHPMPWRYAMIGNNVQIVDAKGEELPLFLMLDFVSMITAAMAKQDAKAAAAGSL